MIAHEINFDGLVGLTHNYSGLSVGNVASLEHKDKISNPREAALQGLDKMKFMMDLGLKQAILPPHERPHTHTLRTLGFTGTDETILKKVAVEAPYLLNNCSSASAMWTANAATVSPSADCSDGRVHITPANLNNKFHRSIEPAVTGRVLKAIFHDPEHFVIHSPLPQVSAFGDEGAANHTRLCATFAEPGLELFVFGRHAFQSGMPKPIHFPARQTLEASAAIAKLHQLKSPNVILAQQNPLAIDKGVFHNDVISVGNQNVFLYHSEAFVNGEETLTRLREQFKRLSGYDLCLVRITSDQFTVEDAVKSYLFNSQLVTLPDSKMALIAPSECKENKMVRQCIEQIVMDRNNPVNSVHYLNVKQSMQNGGGPACLRLRVTLTEMEIQKTNPRVFLTDNLYQELKVWIQKNYRDRLSPQDLSDPQLLSESRTALDQLTDILALGNIYDFQR